MNPEKDNQLFQLLRTFNIDWEVRFDHIRPLVTILSSRDLTEEEKNQVKNLILDPFSVTFQLLAIYEVPK